MNAVRQVGRKGREVVPHVRRTVPRAAVRWPLPTVVLCAAALMGFSGPPAHGAEDFRTWTSTGGSQIEARFAGYDGTLFVVLERRDGTRLKIRRDGLTPADRELLPAAVTSPAPAPGSGPDAVHTPGTPSVPPRLPGRAEAGGPTSKLWGRDGELWTPDSRLPDFSFAGYRGGTGAPPDMPVSTSVRDHGARGNGHTDDTAAFLAAVQATSQGAILVPAGRYVLTDTVTLSRGGVVLRGEGPDRTVLVCPKPLAQIHPAPPVDEFKSKYSFSGGFIAIRGGSRSGMASAVSEPAKRGDMIIVLADASAFRPGSAIRLTMTNAASLGRHIHADRADPGKATFKECPNFMDWIAWVTAVDGGRVTLDRPLRLDLRPEWSPLAWTWAPTTEDQGVEHLSFEFPGVPKKPHLEEEGYNGIHMSGVINGWVRDVAFADCDNGVIATGCRFCLIENTRFTAPKRKDPTGHHALWVSGRAQDCLVTRFDIGTRFVHDLTVEGLANGNVFSKGRTVQMTFDHHANMPYENLFTDIDAGDPSKFWVSGGRNDRGPHAGARSTFWNIRTKGASAAPLPDWPMMNLIGVHGYSSDRDKDGSWIEKLSGVVPPDLHEAQRARRLSGRR